jgi:chromosome segregation ATPase
VRLGDLERELRRRPPANASSQAELTALQTEHAALRERHEALVAARSEATSELSRLREAAQAQAERLSVATAAGRDAEARAAKAREAQAALATQLATLEVERDGLLALVQRASDPPASRQMTEQADAMVQRLRQDLARVENERDRARDEAKELEQWLVDVKRESDTQATRLAAEGVAQTERLRAVQQELQTLRGEHELVRARLAQLTSGGSPSAALAALTRDRDAARAEVARLEGEARDMRTRADEVQRELAKAWDELSAMEVERTAAQGQVDELGRRLAAAEDQRREESEKLDQLENRIVELTG